VILAGVATALGLGAGVLAGRRLAARGITAQNALVGRQKQAYLVLAIVAAFVGVVYFGPELDQLQFVPDAFVLYGEELLARSIVAFAAFAFGLLAGLEARRALNLRSTTFLACLVLLAGLLFLLARTRPVLGLLQAAVVHDGVVWQTTAYTCAPASIATLSRLTGADTTMTERAVVTMARTTREGTSALGEIQAMRRLGLDPRYARFLTPESLAVVGRLAVLHVDEPVGSTTIRHAVALLSVDTVSRTITIGNPLHGRQRIRYDALRGYWIGEAVFAMRPAT